MSAGAQPREPSPGGRQLELAPRTRAGSWSTLLLGVAVFTSGAVLLGVEIAASRVVAPYFGSSLFVWGSLIGVVLTGLAVGYWLGGALADRAPSPILLGVVMSVGALLVLAIPLVDEPVLRRIVEWNPGPRLNPLLAAIALFGPVSVVLAGVTPIGVRLVARSLEHVGRSSGRLFAVSTAGSIAGTFATAFFLIPELGTQQLLGFAAAALFAGVLVLALGERVLGLAAVGAVGAAIAVAAGIALAPGAGTRLTGVAAENFSPLYRIRGEGEQVTVDYGAEGLDVVFRRETRYHNVAVVDGNGERYLRFDNSYQSAMDLRQPFRTVFEYSDMFSLGLAYNPGARDILFVGLGGGSSPKRLWRDFPNLQIDVVELDPVVVDVAYRYFRVPRSPRLRTIVEDGRRFLASTERRWDVIALDAYYSDSVPFHLTTQEFFELVRSRLRPGGVVVSNVIGALAGRHSRLARSIARTYRTTFPTVLVHPVNVVPSDADDAIRNLGFVAMEGAAPDEAVLEDRWRQLRQRAPSAPALTRLIRDRRDEPLPIDDVPVLTDDYAPTDALLLFDQ